jgi:hypothetical protein
MRILFAELLQRCELIPELSELRSETNWIIGGGDKCYLLRAQRILLGRAELPPKDMARLEFTDDKLPVRF